MKRSYLAVSSILALVCLVMMPVAPVTAQERVEANAAPAASDQARQAKYIFLLIGDGMSMMQRTAAEFYLAGPTQEDAPLVVPRLAMNSLPVAGMTYTTAWNAHVTDSAASATAMATGRKTRAGRLSVEPVLGEPMETIAELLQQRGWRIGLASSSPIDDATAGAFYAHEPTRRNRYEIAMSAANSGVYYLGGAGPNGARMADGDERESPIERARKNGYTLVHTREQLLALESGSGPVWAFPAGRGGTWPLGMPFHQDLSPTDASLVDYARKGIELLENDTGFFFMIEGGLTDWAGHGNCLASSIREVLLLDEVLREVLKFYARHPDETLIIVTGDHDTGALSMGSALSEHNQLRQNVDGQIVSMATVMQSIKTWREEKTTFEDALPRILEMFTWQELPEEDVENLRQAFDASMSGLPMAERSAEMRRTYGRLDPLQAFLLWKVARDSGMTWTTTGHSSLPVMTTAMGVGAEKFGGWHDNTDIFHFMLQAAGIEVEREPATEATTEALISLPARVALPAVP